MALPTRRDLVSRRLPRRIGPGAEAAEGRSADQVTLGVVDCRVGGEESLGRRLALEQLLLPHPSSDRQVLALRANVLS